MLFHAVVVILIRLLPVMKRKAPQVIILYRHGKVGCDVWRWCRSSALRQVVNAYDAGAVIVPTQLPSAVRPDLVIVSTKSRSEQSAKMLFGGFDERSDLFREAELPDLPFVPIHLPAILWLVTARLVWRLGWRQNCESHADFKRRAEMAARHLVGRCADGRSVALMGHAILNREIARVLRRDGFRGLESLSRAHWSASNFRRSM